MKYGETLRQRSIPAWSPHNIDYEEIKLLIKEHTTPGQGKTVSVPGRGGDKLQAFESDLLHIFTEQHHRIDLFVKSKAGEIQRRLDDSRKQLERLSKPQRPYADNRIQVARLRRYSRLEDVVIKAGDDIKSLARFNAANRTAIRKLLKKYKKWTGSVTLEARFRDEVLSDPKSFTRLDLGPLLDEYSQTRHSLRTLYEKQMQPVNGVQGNRDSKVPASDPSVVQILQDAMGGGSKVHFDIVLATVPLGGSGTVASYFIHPENLIELQMLLLQHARFFFARSRSNSLATPVSASPLRRDSRDPCGEASDFHLVAADDLERFVHEQSALTVVDREHTPGSRPQRTKALVAWNNDEDALAYVCSPTGERKTVTMKRKHAHSFLDRKAAFAVKEAVAGNEDVRGLRQELLKDTKVEPLFHISSCRSRFVGLNESSDNLALGTLDTNITIAGADSNAAGSTDFPFAILVVRQEGGAKQELIAALDSSHVAERIRGFSLEYHAVYQALHPTDISPPFWLPLLSRDIRKLPPPALKRSSTAEKGAALADSTGSRASRSSNSTTAVETPAETLLVIGAPPPLKSFRRKKKRPAYDLDARQPAAGALPQQQQRYWSEYDHPESGDDADAFVIYIDPNQRSAVDRFFDRIGAAFGGRRAKDDRDLASAPLSPTTREGETSSDDDDVDEESGLLSWRSKRPQKTANASRLPSFGTFPAMTTSGSHLAQNARRAGSWPPSAVLNLPQAATICFTASLAILVVAYFLALTGRRKLYRAVDSGILFAVASSLVFVISGCMVLLRHAGPGRSRRGGSAGEAGRAWWIAAALVVLVDCVGSGGLVAWMFG